MHHCTRITLSLNGICQSHRTNTTLMYENVKWFACLQIKIDYKVNGDINLKSGI